MSSLTVDTTGFRKICEGLADVGTRAGFSVNTEKAIKIQTAMVIETAIKFTPSRKTDAIRAGVENMAKWRNEEDGTRKISINSGRRKAGTEGRIWYSPDRSKGVWRMMGDSNFRFTKQAVGGRSFQNAQRMLAKLKARTKAEKKKEMDARLRARGLTKRSWLQIAERLGIENLVRIGEKSFVMRATPRNGKIYENGRGFVFRGAAQLFIQIENDFPILLKKTRVKSGKRSSTVDGWNILQRAINTRINAFRREAWDGVKADLSLAVKRYPGLKFA